MVAIRTVRTGVNPNVIVENDRPGEFLISEMGAYHCRGNRIVDGGLAGVANNSVLAKTGRFDGILFEGVRKGVVAQRGVIERGPCEVSVAKLVFPTVTNAADGPDAGSDNVAENAAATAALRTQLLADMAAAGIVVRD